MKIQALAAVSILILATGASLAEPTHPNEVGLYTTTDGSGGTGTFVIGQPVDVYMVLTMPADVTDGNAPFNVVTGLELTMHFDPAPDNDLILLNTELPPGSIDIGFEKDINSGMLDFIVGIPDGSAVVVVDEAAMLMRLTFLNLNSHVTQVSLQPWNGGHSVPGYMAFLGGMVAQPPYVLLPMYSMGGSHEAPVFEFNGSAVVVEAASFGTVKALYR